MRAPCSVEGCDKPSAARGWCGTHWMRWRRNGDPLKVKRPGVDFIVKPVCSVDGCDQPNKAHTFCNKHLKRWYEHGDPLVVSDRVGRPPKGEFPQYTSAHRRVGRVLGRARDHACTDCEGRAAEWSYMGGDPNELSEIRTPGGQPARYSLDPSFYVPRCVKCHRVRDCQLRGARQ